MTIEDAIKTAIERGFRFRRDDGEPYMKSIKKCLSTRHFGNLWEWGWVGTQANTSAVDSMESVVVEGNSAE
jgi:hypothetical protein